MSFSLNQISKRIEQKWIKASDETTVSSFWRFTLMYENLNESSFTPNDLFHCNFTFCGAKGQGTLYIIYVLHEVKESCQTIDFLSFKQHSGKNGVLNLERSTF